MYLFLLSTSLSCLSVFHNRIMQFALSNFFQIKTLSSPIKNEILSIEAELSKVSMVDEFPKYARLQRKLNALKEQFKTDAQNKATVNLRFRFFIRLLLQAPFIVISIFSFYMFRSVPVIKFPTEWLEPYPFPSLLSWPSGEIGAVSFLVWFSISSQVFRLVNRGI